MTEHPFAFSGTISGTARCVNTKRSLTHSLDLGEEGIAVQANTPESSAEGSSGPRRGKDNCSLCGKQVFRLPHSAAEIICLDCRKSHDVWARMIGTGRRRHPLYKAWGSMMSRCYNPRHIAYARYGGRGIGIYEEWHDFSAYAAWMDENLGERPPGKTLDRIDGDKGYEPGNVRWATYSEQIANSTLHGRTPAERRQFDETVSAAWMAGEHSQAALARQLETTKYRVRCSLKRQGLLPEQLGQ